MKHLQNHEHRCNKRFQGNLFHKLELIIYTLPHVRTMISKAVTDVFRPKVRAHQYLQFSVFRGGITFHVITCLHHVSPAKFP